MFYTQKLKKNSNENWLLRVKIALSARPNWAAAICFDLATATCSVTHQEDTMGVLGKICPKIPRNVIFARISLFLVPMALTCIKEHMKIEKGRWRSQRPFQRPETQMMRN